MGNCTIIANWKSHKTEEETKTWFQVFSENLDKTLLVQKTIIIAPSFSLLALCRQLLKDYDLSGVVLAAQDVSPFDEGSYTGAVNARQIKEFADYVILGHSERRKFFHEDDTVIEKKAAMAVKYGLIPILCVQDAQTKIPSGTQTVAYEPTWAIGTGDAEDPKAADLLLSAVRKKHGVEHLLYGGSVTEKNVSLFTNMPHIQGALVGSASLDGSTFAKIIKNA